MTEATRWFVVMHDDPTDATVRPAFEAWRQADVRHDAAYTRLQRLWGASAHAPSLVHRPATATDRRTVLRGIVGGTLAVGATLGAGRLVLGPNALADYRTRPGERMAITLRDGSRVELSTSTAMSIDFSARLRRVSLLAGEAWFDVVKDAQRPFVVEAVGGRAQPRAGAFSVVVQDDGALINAAKGAVEARGGGASVVLAEGQSVVAGSFGVGTVRAMDPHALGWRYGRLDFINRTVRDVIATLDRWSGARTVIVNEDLGQRVVTLMISVNDVDAALTRLSEIVPMRIARLPGVLTVIR